MPLLDGSGTPGRDRAFVEFNGVNSLATSMVSVRHGNLKYGWNCSNLDELYNLADDPHETHDLIDDPGYAARVREMREMILEWMLETRYSGAAVSMFRQSRLGKTWY